MAIDVAAARADTRGTEHVTHFDHAGSSLMPRPVVEAVVAHLRREEEVGGYAAAAEAAARPANVHASLAGLIGASPGEIAVLESGSTAWAAAVGRLPLRGPRVLLGRHEYWNNVLVLRQLARRHDLELVVLDDDGAGRVDLGHLARELQRDDVALVALTHVAMAGGRVQPAAEVGRACRAAQVPYVLDACQSAGQLPLDVEVLGCDVLVGTGRKFLRGPRGTAFAYVRRGLLEDPEPAGGDGPQAHGAGARGLESWETGVAARLGLGRAVDYALDLGLEAVQERVLALAGILRARLEAAPGTRVHHPGPDECGTVLFSVRGRSADQVRAHLAGQQVNVSTAPLPPSTAEETLHPMAEGRTLAVRASVHYCTTEDEIDRLVRALR